MAELAQPIAASYREVSLSDQELSIEYGSDWGADTDPTVSAGEQAHALAEALAARRRGDMERRVTTVGPHRDDPGFALDGHDARIHASQGEQRTVALAVRLAVHAAVTDRVGSAPLLLLDDVFSELDAERSRRLAAALPATQTVITSARPEDVPLSGRRWSVVDGRLIEETR